MNAITTFTGREFNQDTSRAKRAARNGPVFITDRGRPAHVLLTIEEYERLTPKPRNALQAFAQEGGPEYDFEVEFPRSRELPREIDFGLD